MTNAPAAFVDDQTIARTILILYATETGNAEDTAFHARVASVDTYPLVSGVARIRRM
jgi:hypothetical protein